MEPSTIDTEAQGSLKDAYAVFTGVNEQLRNVQWKIFCASDIWSVLANKSEDSERPEHWTDSRGKWECDSWEEDEGLVAWLKEARGKNLFKLKSVLRTELATLGELKKDLEDIQQNHRRRIDRLSRRKLRPWHILDMPEEILSSIFETLEGFRLDMPPAWHIPSKDIRNCRLTCRAFCRASSRFLLRSVPVDLSVTSLSRFEEISRHPIISRGVRSVRVLLHYFDPVLSEDFAEFLMYRTADLESQVEMIEVGRPWQFLSVSEASCLDTLGKLKAALDSWRRIATEPRTPHESEEDSRHRQLLEETHQRYQRLYLDQKELRESGKFLQAVGAGIARMPHARALSLLDNDPLICGRLAIYSEDPALHIYKEMLRPMDYDNAFTYGYTPKLTDMIAEIPVAVRQAGAWVESIEIELSYVENPLDLLPGLAVQRQLPSAVRQLKKLFFTCTRWENTESGDEALYDTLASCLDTSSLQQLILNISLNEQSDVDGRTPAAVGRLITSRRWPNLSYLCLRDVTVHLSELQLFVQGLRAQFCSVTLNHVRLLSGTWAEVLDAMHGKCGPQTELSRPLGAECDLMSDDELSYTFDRESLFSLSKAELYMRGITDLNPLMDSHN